MRAVRFGCIQERNSRGEYFGEMNIPKAPLISVVLPYRNAGCFLEPAVDSVLRSTFPNFELILIDDESSDGAEVTAGKYELSEPRVRAISNRGSGLVDALNTGLAASRAEFVARMDVDDVCHPDRLASQHELLRTNDTVCLVSCLVEPMHKESLSPGMRDYLSWVNRSVTSDQIQRDLFIESPLPHPSVMFRKDAVHRTGGYRDYDGPEDYDLWMRLALDGGRFAKVPRPLLTWRIHAGSLSRTDPRYRSDAFVRRKFGYLLVWLNKKGLGAGKRLRICGAGKFGRKLQRFLSENGFAVEAFIDTKRIGDKTLALPVLSPDSVQIGEDGYFYFGAVGTWAGRRELEDFFNRVSKELYRDYVVL